MNKNRGSNRNGSLRRNRSLRRNKSLAFTLIEVIIAILILSSSLVILLGLQSTAVSKALRDRNQLQAMLAAKSIMAAIETSDEISPRDETLPVVQLIEELNAMPQQDLSGQDSEANIVFDRMTATLTIDVWPNPEPLVQFNLPNDLLLRVLLLISWGDSPDDQLETVYFVPNTP